MAKGLALGSGLPLLGINHLEAHLYSAWLFWQDERETAPQEPQFPLLALIVSGGHTELILMRDHLDYERLGATLDDAAGEAFDKVARLLGLPYPGGPAIQITARDGNAQAIAFPRAWLEGTWDFSFSGLKTAVMREVRALEGGRRAISVADFAASFQEAVVDVLVTKTLRAAEDHYAKEILVAGGVSANQLLRERFLESTPLPVHIPSIALCTDNAAMIAGVGCYRFQAGQRDDLGMDVLPNWPLSDLNSLSAMQGDN
jgi:N6-L-threonylcarbamoyladenine synthase